MHRARRRWKTDQPKLTLTDIWDSLWSESTLKVKFSWKIRRHNIFFWLQRALRQFPYHVQVYFNTTFLNAVITDIQAFKLEQKTCLYLLKSKSKKNHILEWVNQQQVQRLNRSIKVKGFFSEPFWFFYSQDLISNSLYYLPNDSHHISLENLVLDHWVIP